jgi:LDH2 family malate/lactate/ureidoglycolate dehydrogenase
MTVSLSVDEARSLAERCLQTAGYSAAESAIIADPMIECELRGVTSGGLPRLLSVLERLRDTPQPAGQITLLREKECGHRLTAGTRSATWWATRRPRSPSRRPSRQASGPPEPATPG